MRRAVLLLLLATSAASWTARLRWQTSARPHAALTFSAAMCVGNGGGDSDGDGDGDGDAAGGGGIGGGGDNDRSLQASLKRAAAAKLGASIESMMPLADRAWSSAGSSKMAAALQEGRERLAERKAEVGDEAALEPLTPSLTLTLALTLSRWATSRPTRHWCPSRRRRWRPAAAVSWPTTSSG